MSESQPRDVPSEKTKNLPALANRLGEGVVEVLNYEQHRDLSRQEVYSILKIIQQNPEIAESEEQIDLVADLASWYKENLDKEFADLVSEYDIANVYFAIEYLFDSGKKGFFDSKNEKQELRSELMRLLVFIQSLNEVGYQPTMTEEFHELIIKLGGYEAAVEINRNKLEEYFLNNHLI